MNEIDPWDYEKQQQRVPGIAPEHFSQGYVDTYIFVGAEARSQESYRIDAIGMMVGILIGLDEKHLEERNEYILKSDMSYLTARLINSKFENIYDYLPIDENLKNIELYKNFRKYFIYNICELVVPKYSGQEEDELTMHIADVIFRFTNENNGLDIMEIKPEIFAEILDAIYKTHSVFFRLFYNWKGDTLSIEEVFNKVEWALLKG